MILSFDGGGPCDGMVIEWESEGEPIPDTMTFIGGSGQRYEYTARWHADGVGHYELTKTTPSEKWAQ